MPVTIHPSAIVHANASIGENVGIGPYAIVEEDVVIGDGCEIGPYAMIASGTRLGKQCRVFNGASLGTIPQDLKFGEEKTILKIGDQTTIREFCTLNRGTKATGETVLGSHCLLMAYCHIAHDCRIGDYFIAANSVNLAGHVTIGNHVNSGGIAAVVQFRTVGDHSFIGAFSLIVKDVVPFAKVAAAPMRIVGVNKVGLERSGFDENRRRQISRAYKVLFRSGLTCQDAVARLAREFPGNPDVESIIAFARKSSYGLLRMGESED
jgi:acyl-[acyl-carrier-protein]--UDP-N-acetylglucosamine O-acyltransferase